MRDAHCAAPTREHIDMHTPRVVAGFRPARSTANCSGPHVSRATGALLLTRSCKSRVAQFT